MSTQHPSCCDCEHCYSTAKGEYLGKVYRNDSEDRYWYCGRFVVAARIGEGTQVSVETPSWCPLAE